MGSYVRFEFPDHLTILLSHSEKRQMPFVHADRCSIRLAHETLTGKLRTSDLLRHIVPERTLGIGFSLRDKIASNSNKHTVWLNNARGRLGRSAGMVDDL